MQLSHNKILITGGASGIGLGYAQVMAANGAKDSLSDSFQKIIQLSSVEDAHHFWKK
jgi:NAD(P)-dependent dehydrogenase (short-subunit alcohol dehydrogenase family)